MSESPADVARAHFTDPDRRRLGGALATWARWAAGVPDPFAHAHRVDGIELIEETGDRAVVDLRGESRSTLAGSTQEWRFSLNGPAVLERTEGEWRVVDYTLDGRRRSHSLVLGPLAEQERERVVVRVLGVDRRASSTSVLLEIENGSAAELRVDRALIRIFGSWAPAHAAAGPVPGGETRSVLVTTTQTISLTADALSVGLRLRDGQRRLDFLLEVPLRRPNELVRQRPPRRLPLLPHTRRSALLVLAGATAATALLLGWSAILLPIFVGLSLWRRVRLRVRNRALRVVLDPVVVAAALALLWFTPAVELALPVGVGIVAWAALRVLRLSEGRRMAVAWAAFAVWLILLGGPNDTFSPCRVGDGSPTHVADTFARAVYRGDLAAARKVADHRAIGSGILLPRDVPPARAVDALANRRDATGGPICKLARSREVTRCYVYEAPRAAATTSLWVAVGCDVRHWRVRSAL
jgi:hypothetical protein